jgi:hypothetical protein
LGNSALHDDCLIFLIVQEFLKIHEPPRLQMIDSQPTSIGLSFALLRADTESEMTLRMERFSVKRGTRLRVSGELRNEQLDDLRSEIERGGAQVTLDLDELNLVDVDAVRFLNACGAQGLKIVNCSPYIREWMYRERKQKD